MPGLEASGAPLHAATLLSTARAEHRGGKSRLARWELLTARVLCLFAGTTGVYPRAYRKGTRSRVRRVARAEHRGSKSQLVAKLPVVWGGRRAPPLIASTGSACRRPA